MIVYNIILEKDENIFSDNNIIKYYDYIFQSKNPKLIIMFSNLIINRGIKCSISNRKEIIEILLKEYDICNIEELKYPIAKSITLFIDEGIFIYY